MKSVGSDGDIVGNREEDVMLITIVSDSSYRLSRRPGFPDRAGRELVLLRRMEIGCSIVAGGRDTSWAAGRPVALDDEPDLSHDWKIGHGDGSR